MTGSGQDPMARLDQAIAAARHDEPSAAQLARVRERIVQLGAGTPSASGAHSGPGAAALVKVSAAVALIVALTAGWMWIAGTMQRSTRPARAPVDTAAGHADPVAPDRSAERVHAPVLQAAPRATATDPADAGDSERSTTDGTAPALRGGAVSMPARAPAKQRARSRLSVQPSAPEQETAPEQQADLPERGLSAPQHDDSEIALLRAARRALGGDPAGALRLADRHAERFPEGVLREEREVIAIEALSRLGEQSAARARADRFAALFPGSVHRARVRRAVEQRP